MACHPLLLQLKVPLGLGSVDMVDHKALPLVVEVVGAQLAEEGLIPGMVLPDFAPSIFADENVGITLFGHLERLSLDSSSLVAFSEYARKETERQQQGVIDIQ